MKYTQLEDDYKYDTLAEAIYGREVEFFHYEFDLKNFQHLVEIMSEGDNKEDIKGRITEIKGQMGNVDAIYHALQAQIEDKEAYAEAVERVTQKRKEKVNEVCSCSK